MDKQRCARRRFIVMGATGVDFVADYLSHNYRLSEISENARTGDTGHLELFRIDPISSGLPAFVVRIGHDNHEAVDVDLIGDERERIAFKTQAPGYNGHKAQSLGTNPRSYQLGIEVPSVGKVLSGTVTMKGVDLGVRLGFAGQATIGMNATLTTDVKRARKPSES